MQYFINKKNIKQSVQNLSNFLKEKNFDIPRNIIFEAFSKALFFKNYNTLEGLSSKPSIIEHLPEKKSYMIEVEANITSEKFLEIFHQSIEHGKCEINIHNFLHENQVYHMEIGFPRTNDNFLIAMFFLASFLKPYQVKRFDLLRIVFEKESLLGAMQLNLPANK